MIPDLENRDAKAVCAMSLRRNRALGRPLRIAYAFKIHLEKSDRFLPRHYAIPDFAPASILDHSRVADRHRSRRNLPGVAIRGRLKREVSSHTHGMGVQCEIARPWVVGKLTLPSGS